MQKTRKKIYNPAKYREYYQKNCERKKSQQKEYRKNNQEHVKHLRKLYYNENKDVLKKRQREYRKKNLIIIKEMDAIRQKKKLQTDPLFRLVCNLLRRVLTALQAQSSKKYLKTFDLVGISIEGLWKHLESQFREGMTRENHGLKGWHVDHVRPCSSFDLSDPEEQKKCFHYTNLQPLWWWENLEKSDKII